MKIAFISDLHVDSSPENLKLLDHLVERLGSLNPDTFIIAGDISASTEVFEKTLKRFSAISCHKLLVAGNHDIWVDPKNGLKKGLHSGIKYSEVIPDICERNDFTCLGLEPYSINGIGFAGTIGWYDYTLRNKKYDTMFSMETYRNKRYQDKHTWNDLHFAHWMDNAGKRRSDEEVAHEMESSLKKQLQSLVRKRTKAIVVVTHHVPFKEMVVHPNVLPFDFFSAFMGSEGLGKIILEERNVTHVICGHSHLKSSLKAGNTHAMKSPVGYFREWRTKNLTEHIGERLTCVDIS